MRIMAVTQNFGFGPTSMLNRALDLMPKNWHVDAYIPTHLVGVFDKRTNVDIHSTALDIPVLARSGAYDAAVLTCDYDLASTLRCALGKVVVFDMLFWFWPTIHPVVYRNILVIAQNFYGVGERSAYSRSVHVVGPLLPPVDTLPLSQRDGGVLVNLGGFTSPYNGASGAVCYARIIAPTVRMLLSTERNIVIMGGLAALKALGVMVPECKNCIHLFCHEEARRSIARASCYLTISGLGSIYEPFLAGTPTFFLPPTNYTQALQMQALIENLAYRWAVPFLRPQPGCDEGTYIARLLARKVVQVV